ncbi:ammonium transporter [Candidatus Peribacteria bacterium]|nr:ammonium transporter [Candidatus Peribacteria bacterium]
MELTLDVLKNNLDTTWVLLTGCLVFFMNAGFACIEAGFCRAKNLVHVLAMNYIIIACTSMAFWAFGFGIMFGNGNGFIGMTGFFPNLLDKSAFTVLQGSGVAVSALFFFQMVFADTAGTILSGVVAERMKFSAYLLFAAIMGSVLYPVTGHWIWGGGWLSVMGFHDFAGSTVVHSIGGWVGLTGALMVGARMGKYDEQGRPRAIRAHNAGLIALGGFILWLGWFGFNPGSTLAADGRSIGYIFMTTNMAGAAGTFSTLFMAWLYSRKIDFHMCINGTLAGLVAITAPCDTVSIAGAVGIGTIAGVLTYYTGFMFERAHIDDPVGALSVHLVNGIWGTMAVGIFGTAAGSVGPVTGLLYGGGFAPLGIQLVGIAAVGAYTVVGSLIVWSAVKMTVGLRVSPLAELEGLDEHDHGYPGYMMDDDLSDFAPLPASDYMMPSKVPAFAEKQLLAKK